MYVEEKEGILSAGALEPGNFVSMDQFIVKTPGRLPTGYGWEGHENRYHGGTIFNDAVSGAIWVENQVSLGAGETIEAKLHFEQWLRGLPGSKCNTIGVTMECSLSRSLLSSASLRIRNNLSLVLGPST